VRAAVVVARPDPAGNARLVAYVVPATNSSEELRGYLEQRLPEYMIPAAIVTLEQLPLTPNGKIDLKALPVPDLQAALAEGYEAPRTDLETRLAEIWAEVLGLKQVGINDNFFALGGNSLLATRIITRLPEAMQLELPLRQMFAAPTVAGFAQLIAESEGATPAEDSSIGATERGELSLADLLAEVNNLSDDEALALLD